MDRRHMITGDRLWGARRIQVQTFNRLMAGIALAISSTWLGWWAAAFALPALALWLVRRRPPGSPAIPVGSTIFGGHRFRSTLMAAPDSALRHLADGEGELALSVWLVAWDDAGFPWTLISRRDDGFGPTMTIRATGAVDPFAVVQRNLAASLDVATVHTRVLGLGKEGGTEQAAFVVEGSLTAARLSELELDDADPIFVEVHPDPVARTMARTAAEDWTGASALSLVALVEDYYPASGSLIEGFVEEGWRTSRQFGRLERLTDGEDPTRSSSDVKVPAPPHSPVVVTTDGGEIVEVHRRYPTDQVLNWEAPTRAVPNRY